MANFMANRFRHRAERAVTKFQIALTLATFGLFTTQAFAGDQVLFKAVYSGKYSGMNIESTRTLFVTPSGQYYIESEMKNFLASIYERSDFNIQSGLLKPLHYRYKRSITGIKAKESLYFNWEAEVAEYRRKDKPEKNKDYPIKLGVLDPVLYQLQLQRDAYSGNTHFDLTFVKPSKIKNLRFHTVNREPFTVDSKTYTAVRIERINLDDDKQTRVWLIPEFNYQIARIEHIEEDGKAYNLYLTSYSSSPELIEHLYKSNPGHSRGNNSSVSEAPTHSGVDH